MSYTATVYKVMIASPSDVPDERIIIREVINEWNAIQSEHESIVLMPISWETHASPEFGRPQEIINRQVLKDADLLIAAFWSRIGSPTGKAASGTIEEIESHIATGKPAMIYFSSALIPQDVDPKQFNALKKFKIECQQKSLYEVYNSLGDLRTKFARQLAQQILHHFSGFDKDVVAEPLDNGPVLTDVAEQLLVEISKDPMGQLMRIRTMGGLSIVTNGQEFITDGNPREEARWDSALSFLRDLNLVKDRGYKGEIFGLTERGYTLTESIIQKN